MKGKNGERVKERKVRNEGKGWTKVKKSKGRVKRKKGEGKRVIGRRVKERVA